MKKLLAMVMAVAMTLSLAACGGNSTPAASGSTGSASSAAGSAANFKNTQRLAGLTRLDNAA